MSKLKKKKQDFSENIMAKIQKEKITMKPKAFFILGSLLLGSGTTGFILLAAFFFNHVFYRLRTNGSLEFLWFGQFGLHPFLDTFPWISLIISFFAILGGIFLLKKYEISYKKNFLVLSLAILLGAILTGLFVDLSGLNEKISQQHFSQRGIMKKFFQHKFEGNDWLLGEIKAFSKKDKSITITTPDDKIAKIIWDNDTLLPSGNNFEIGQKIRMVGEWQGEIFVAKGIRSRGMRYRAGNSEQNGSVKGIFIQELLKRKREINLK